MLHLVIRDIWKVYIGNKDNSKSNYQKNSILFIINIFFWTVFNFNLLVFNASGVAGTSSLRDRISKNTVLTSVSLFAKGQICLSS